MRRFESARGLFFSPVGDAVSVRPSALRRRQGRAPRLSCAYRQDAQALKTVFADSDLPGRTRRRLELAVVVAQERLLGVHVEHAEQLVTARGPGGSRCVRKRS